MVGPLVGMRGERKDYHWGDYQVEMKVEWSAVLKVLHLGGQWAG